MKELIFSMLPEIILCATACVLLLMGMSSKASTRRTAPVLAILALAAAGASQWPKFAGMGTHDDAWKTVHIFEFARYIKVVSAAIGVLLAMLAWPSDREATGNAAIHFGTETSEFFALLLLSIAGIFLIAGANDTMLLFLGLELASIPTYIMVSISRPLACAQEAGVKYFFLGAMAAALMLFGFSYLYGVTGTTKLDEIARMTAASAGKPMAPWELLAVVVLITGFAFKMAAVPLHGYAGDVYEGAATPVTAFLSFVPKISGFVALLKILYAITGGTWAAPETIVKTLWAISILTMCVGNVLGLVQSQNVKRVLAYSSVAHSGYMLAGVTALISTHNPDIQNAALQGVLFYLTAYGLMNLGAFGVLILLPSKDNQPATSAETFDDLAGLGRKHLLLGLAMAVSCFSLIGLPLTVGFFGKLYLIAPALSAGLTGLVIVLVLNAAVSAAYYLKIVAALFLRPGASDSDEMQEPIQHPLPILFTVAISMVGVLWLGTVLPATGLLTDRTYNAANISATDFSSSK